MWITTGGRIGIHAVHPKNCLAHLAALRARGGRFPVVKAVDDMDWLAQVKQFDAGIITIGRIVHAWEGLPGVEQEANPGIYAARLLAPIHAKLQANPGLRSVVDYWEVCNEPDPPGAGGYHNLGVALIACLDAAEAEGLKLALPGLNAGTPEWWEMQALVNTGLFGRIKTGGHIVTLHEGVFKHPTQGWIDPVDLWWPGGIPVNESGQPLVSVPGAGPLCFRYRFLYNLLAQRQEICPLVISEIVYGGGYAQDGGSAVDTAARAAWYDGLARHDYFLLAHLPFTLGSNTGEEWARRDYEFAYPALIDYMAGVSQRPNAAPPDEEEDEMPPDEFPLSYRFTGSWYDEANKQIPLGWQSYVEIGDNPYGDGQPWNDFVDPEWVHIFLASDPIGWEQRGELHFFNEDGVTYKMFAGNHAWKGGLFKVMNLEQGLHTLAVSLVGDCYNWAGHKEPVSDPLHARLWLYVGGDRKEVAFDNLGENVVSADFLITEAGTYAVGFEFLFAYAASNNGAFVREINLRYQPQEGGLYRVIYNLYPQTATLDEMAAVVHAIAPERGTMGGSHNDAINLVKLPTSRPDSLIRLWFGRSRYNPDQLAALDASGLTVVEAFP